MSTTPEKTPAKRNFKIKIDPNNRIVIKGAREHNLKNVSLELPRDKLIVMTGLSGSGKSSLAFDTIFADGQRRYMESLSSYARQFLGQMEKPDVDEITGLSPAISIDQKTTSHNPRSTVGTVTEIYDYLRLMYARIGVPHCPICGREITQQTVDEMVDEVLKLPERTRFQVLAPVVRARKGTQAKELDAARRAGFARVRIDGNMYDLSEEISLEKNIKHTVEIVVDRLVINDTVRGRLADSIETALAQANGLVVIDVIGGEPMMFIDRMEEFIKKLYQNVLVLDSGARSATTSFVENGQGDVLIAWENEAFLSVQDDPDKFEIINPSISVLAQPSVTVVDEVAENRGTADISKEYLNYLYSDDAQRIAADNYYRPVDQKILEEYSDVFDLTMELKTIDDFGGWQEVQEKHFADGGIFDQIYGN